jgi:preprotein translocase SecE subunit
MTRKFILFDYIATAIEEARKVVWPDRETVIRHTAMVIVSVAIAAGIFAGLDYFLRQLVLLAIN